MDNKQGMLNSNENDNENEKMIRIGMGYDVQTCGWVE